jgi:hypothetical protein
MMVNIPMDDVQMLWDKMPEKSWDGMREAAQMGKNSGMEEDKANMIADTADKMKDKPFPDSPEELHEMLNQEMTGEEGTADSEDNQGSM